MRLLVLCLILSGCASPPPTVIMKNVYIEVNVGGNNVAVED